MNNILLLAFAFALAACSGSSAGHNSYGSGDPSLAAPNLGGGPIDPFLTDGQLESSRARPVAVVNSQLKILRMQF
jgi:hypothetical protein